MLHLRSSWLTSHYLPFFVSASLIYFPYFFHDPSDSFPIALLVPKVEHAFWGALTVILIVAPSLLGARIGRLHKPGSLTIIAPRWSFALWGLTYISLAISVIQLAIATTGFAEGNFVAARAAIEFPGIGVLIRLPLITLPLLFTEDTFRKRRLRRTLIAIIGLDVVRSFVMSERTALIEAACLLWVYAKKTKMRFKWRSIFFFGAALIFLFSLILQIRLLVQSELGSTIDPAETTFAQSLAAYYADTTNKYYQAFAGYLKYPAVTALTPLDAALDGRKELFEQYSDYLSAVSGFSPFVTAGLNNSGGLAEDVSDFGPLGLLVTATKFLVFGVILARIDRGPLSAALSALTLIAVLEYPRFNYFNMPFAAYLSLAAIILGFAIRLTINRTARRVVRLNTVSQVPQALSFEQHKR